MSLMEKAQSTISNNSTISIALILAVLGFVYSPLVSQLKDDADLSRRVTTLEKQVETVQKNQDNLRDDFSKKLDVIGSKINTINLIIVRLGEKNNITIPNNEIITASEYYPL